MVAVSERGGHEGSHADGQRRESRRLRRRCGLHIADCIVRRSRVQILNGCGTRARRASSPTVPGGSRAGTKCAPALGACAIRWRSRGSSKTLWPVAVYHWKNNGKRLVEIVQIFALSSAERTHEPTSEVEILKLAKLKHARLA